MPRLLGHLIEREKVRARRGAIVSQIAINAKIPRKKLRRIVASLLRIAAVIN
jgi:hypothetical protein